jgi:hypothetical protein
LDTAFWDAITLADVSVAGQKGFLAANSAHYWMGADYINEELNNRIYGNLNRVLSLKSSTASEYVTLSCNDPEQRCNQKIGNGKIVGGYASTRSGWFGYYHYITFCPPFFTLSNLDSKIEEARKDKAVATDMRYLRNTGQYFLHELMHLRAIYNPEPKIEDLTVGDGTMLAYGPYNVRNLARAKRGNRGADGASRNADSYAMLANSIFFHHVTDYFPEAPQGQKSIDDLAFPHITFETQDQYSAANAKEKFDSEFKRYVDSSNVEIYEALKDALDGYAATMG